MIRGTLLPDGVAFIQGDKASVRLTIFHLGASTASAQIETIVFLAREFKKHASIIESIGYMLSLVAAVRHNFFMKPFLRDCQIDGFFAICVLSFLYELVDYWLDLG